MPSHADESLDDLVILAGGEAAAMSLCEAQGVAPHVLWRLLRGVGKTVRSKTLFGISAALQVSTERVDAAVRVTRASRNGW